MKKVSGRVEPVIFLKRRFNYRNGGLAGHGFILMMSVAFFLFLSADMPERKYDKTKENLYHWNSLCIVTKNHHTYSEVAPADPAVNMVFLDYRGSCPDGNEDRDMDNGMGIAPSYEFQDVITLPYERKLFRLSDRILYGSYFTDVNQIILPYERAVLLNPSHPERLVGKKVIKDFYGIDGAELTIVGIFDRFSAKDQKYMDQFVSRYENLTSLYFINSRFTERLETCESFFYSTRTGGERVYRLFFESYSELKSYYERWNPLIGRKNDYAFQYSDRDDPELFWTLESFHYILLGIAIVLTVLTLLFYLLLEKMEYEHHHGFVPVFEYCGYDRKQVIRKFIHLSMLSYFKKCICAFLLPLGLAVLVNAVNHNVEFSSVELFTFNYRMIVPYVSVVLCVGMLLTGCFYRRVKVGSWYETMLEVRDLL